MLLCHATALIFFLYIYFSDTEGLFLRSQQPYAIRGETFTWVCNKRRQQNPENVVFLKFGNGRSDINSLCTVKMGMSGCMSMVSRYSRYKCGCINNDTSSMYLNITNVHGDDDGKWACKQSSSNTVYPVYLPVYYGPENVRILANTRGRFEFTEGDNATLTCDADCKPQCNIRLYNKTINISDTSSVNKKQLLSSNGSLSLVNISRHINGSTIICQAIHLHPSFSGTSVTTEIKLKVYYVARNIVFSTTNNEAVIEGQDVNITCSSTDSCYPPCTFKWRFISPHRYYPSQYINHYSRNSDIGILSIKSVNRRRSGEYRCEASNSRHSRLHKYRNLILTVCYPPQIKYLRSDATNNKINEGSNITLTCSVDSVPDSNISWSRSKESQLPTIGGKLFIPIATCGHADDYTCTADNGVGQPDTETISVYVRCLRIDQTQTTHGKGVPVIVGDDKKAVLTIHVIAYPLPKFKWFRLYSTGIEKSVTDFSTKQTDTLLSSTLTIEDFTDEDSGYYKVYVENWVVRSHVFFVSNKPIS